MNKALEAMRAFARQQTAAHGATVGICITMWSDGSGRIGTFLDYDEDTGATATLTMNIQAGFNTLNELLADLEHMKAGDS